jgi:4,5-DOPA dioxygenase extradiol
MPKAIIVISAHWLTEGTFVTCDLAPRQIYDFYGFPKELYDIKYPAKGSGDTARHIMESLKNYNINCGEWGMDHASWAVLKHMYPNADIPAVELSLGVGMSPACHFELGEALKPLREMGVLIIGSGNIVHNLWSISPETDVQAFDWAQEFDSTVKELLLKGEYKKLIDYEKLGKAAKLSIPTSEHYLPMLYILGLKEKEEEVSFVHESIQNGSISMRTFIIK